MWSVTESSMAEWTAGGFTVHLRNDEDFIETAEIDSFAFGGDSS
jgi:hypothetical protein